MAFTGSGKIWMNGSLVDWADAKIHIASHVVHYGSGVFEGARYVYEVDINVGMPVRVEVPAPSQTRVFRLGDAVRVECSSDSVALIRDER